jgi:hypothetical protein
MALPSVADSGSIRFESLLHGENVMSALRHLTISVVGSAASENIIRGILDRSNDFKELHFRLRSHLPNDELQLPPTLVQTQSLGLFPLSLATNLTIHGYRFGYRGSGLWVVCFPLLRALAVVDCCSAHHFFRDLQATQFPDLSALMITGHSLLMSDILKSFIEGIKPLRELILVGAGVSISDATLLTNHADTLELLSLGRGPEDEDSTVYLLSGEEMIAMFSSLTALRHLNLCITGDSVIDTRGNIQLVSTSVQNAVVSWNDLPKAMC